MKIIVAPDSFKGSITAEEFCAVAKAEIQAYDDSIEVITIPLADGGEGTLSCLVQSISDMTVLRMNVCGALFDEIIAKIGFLPNETAVIEVASIVGLPMIAGRENPLKTTTYGVGEAVKGAVRMGAKKIVFALGGSSTNDLGLGMLAAMGYRFYDANENELCPIGGNICDIVRLERTADFDLFNEVEFVAMCDVKNPLCGKNGCAHIYARQKGANDTEIEFLDRSAVAFNNLAIEHLGMDYSNVEGAGAAGGLGYAITAFCKGKLMPGIDTVLALTDFSGKVTNADLIITGEGRFDNQSLMGKTIGGLLEKSNGVPIVVFAGKNEYTDRLTGLQVFAISEGQPLSYALAHAKQNLSNCIRVNLPKILSKL